MFLLLEWFDIANIKETIIENSTNGAVGGGGFKSTIIREMDSPEFLRQCKKALSLSVFDISHFLDFRKCWVLMVFKELGCARSLVSKGPYSCLIFHQMMFAEEVSSGSGSGEYAPSMGPGEDDEDSGSGMSFPTDKPYPDIPAPGNDQDNRLHPMEVEPNKDQHNASSTGTSAMLSQRVSLNRALFSYLVPVVVMWVGGAITDWLQ